jgi:hypothetical protein
MVCSDRTLVVLRLEIQSFCALYFTLLSRVRIADLPVLVLPSTS